MIFLRNLLFVTLMTALAGVPVLAQDVFSSAEEIRPLLPGSAVPDVQLERLDGSALSVREAAASKPTVLIFYRGGW